jgi:hypothetical protein
VDRLAAVRGSSLSLGVTEGTEMEEQKPQEPEAIEVLLEEDVAALHPTHRARFESIQVSPRRLAVNDRIGGSVWVVAEHGGGVIYWSDVEEGWEFGMPSAGGSLRTRGSNQLTLSHLMWQLFGDPNAER